MYIKGAEAAEEGGEGPNTRDYRRVHPAESDQKIACVDARQKGASGKWKLLQAHHKHTSMVNALASGGHDYHFTLVDARGQSLDCAVGSESLRQGIYTYMYYMYCYIHVCICTHTHTRVCVYIYIHTYICVYMYAPYMYAYIYIYI